MMKQSSWSLALTASLPSPAPEYCFTSSTAQSQAYQLSGNCSMHSSSSSIRGLWTSFSACLTVCKCKAFAIRSPAGRCRHGICKWSSRSSSRRRKRHPVSSTKNDQPLLYLLFLTDERKHPLCVGGSGQCHRRGRRLLPTIASHNRQTTTCHSLIQSEDQ